MLYTMKHLHYKSIPQVKNLHEVTGYKYICASYTSKLVLDHDSSGVNHIVYLQYGFMATSEPQKNLINKRPGLVVAVFFILA